MSSLPVSWYTDSDQFDREKKIFGQEWLYVCPSSQLTQTGNYVTCSLMDYEIVVIRQASGSAKGFWNTCRHRGSQLLSGSGTCKSECIVCPYHGWTYELSGELRKAPRFTDMEDFCKTDYTLAEIFVYESSGLIFINLNSPKIPDNRFDRLAQILSGYPLDQYAYRSQKSYEIACNWKTYIENYQECYHCRTLHPLFNRNYQLDQYQVSNSDKVSHHTCPPKGEAADAESCDTELRSKDGEWIYCWPNLALALYEHYYDTLEIIPISPDKTKLVITFYGRNDISTEELDRLIGTVSFSTFEEDIEACERVAKGLKSLRMRQESQVVGPLHPVAESGVIYFDSLIRNALID